MVFTKSILNLTLPVTELLQEKEIDMTDASHVLHSLKNVILSKHNTVDEFRNNCYRITIEIAGVKCLSIVNEQYYYVSL